MNWMTTAKKRVGRYQHERRQWNKKQQTSAEPYKDTKEKKRKSNREKQKQQIELEKVMNEKFYSLRRGKKESTSHVKPISSDIQTLQYETKKRKRSTPNMYKTLQNNDDIITKETSLSNKLQEKGIQANVTSIPLNKANILDSIELSPIDEDQVEMVDEEGNHQHEQIRSQEGEISTISNYIVPVPGSVLYFNNGFKSDKNGNALKETAEENVELEHSQLANESPNKPQSTTPDLFVSPVSKVKSVHYQLAILVDMFDIENFSSLKKEIIDEEDNIKSLKHLIQVMYDKEESASQKQNLLNLFRYLETKDSLYEASHAHMMNQAILSPTELPMRNILDEYEKYDTPEPAPDPCLNDKSVGESEGDFQDLQHGKKNTHFDENYIKEWHLFQHWDGEGDLKKEDLDSMLGSLIVSQ